MVKLDFNNENFRKVRTEAECFYHSIGSILCPYFGEKVTFNSKGLRHLKFKSDQQARSHKDQYARLKILYLAPEIISRSHTLQGIWKIRRFERQKINNHWDNILKDVVFYEFIAVLGSIRSKVIIKEVGSGNKYFWSIISYWGIDKGGSRRIFYSGNPEQD